MNDEQTIKRLVNLVIGLTEKTTKGPDSSRLKWEKVGSDTYEISLIRTSLRIGTEASPGEYPYIFTVLDETGSVIERLREDHDSPDYHLAELHGAASRSYTGIDEKLDEIFSELGINEPPF